MKAWIRIAMLVTLTECGTIVPSGQEPKPAVDQSRPAAGAPAGDDNMTPYRKLATDTLQAFKAHDIGSGWMPSVHDLLNAQGFAISV